MEVENARIDTGASVNIILLSMVKNILVFGIKPTASTLEMAGKTHMNPVGTI